MADEASEEEEEEDLEEIFEHAIPDKDLQEKVEAVGGIAAEGIMQEILSAAVLAEDVGVDPASHGAHALQTFAAVALSADKEDLKILGRWGPDDVATYIEEEVELGDYDDAVVDEIRENSMHGAVVATTGLDDWVELIQNAIIARRVFKKLSNHKDIVRLRHVVEERLGGHDDDAGAVSGPPALCVVEGDNGDGRSQVDINNVLNAPGAWDYFISHSRRSADAVVLATELAHELERRGHTIWFDVRMEDRSISAMEEGVRNSRCFVAVVSGPCTNNDRPNDPPEGNAYFRRPFCIKELEWALEENVPIQPVVRIEDKTRIGEFVALLDSPLNMDGELRDVKYLKCLQATDWVDLNRNDHDYWKLGVTKVVQGIERVRRRRSSLGGLLPLQIPRRASDEGTGKGGGGGGSKGLSFKIPPLKPAGWALKEGGAGTNASPVLGDLRRLTPRQKELSGCSDSIGSSASIRNHPAKTPSRRSSVKANGWKKADRGLIGSGAYGRVYQGMNTVTGSLIAIKEMIFSESNVHQVQELNREIDVMKNLDHPNIVKYLGTEVRLVDRTLFIFLEWVPGGSLKSLLVKFGGKFDDSVTRNYTFQILQGLDFLHSNNVVHRDIKGGNVLVDGRGVVKLADFGASKSLSTSRDDGSGGCGEDNKAGVDEAQISICGTPYFMAPEVMSQTGICGHEDTTWKKADIWSVGGTVLQMATGDPPWKSLKLRGLSVLLMHVVTCDKPPPIPESVSSEVCSLLEMCFQREPTLRPSAAELMQHPFVKGAGDDFGTVTIGASGARTVNLSQMLEMAKMGGSSGEREGGGGAVEAGRGRLARGMQWSLNQTSSGGDSSKRVKLAQGSSSSSA